MDQRSVYAVLLARANLSLASSAPARITYDDSPLPRLVATVITLMPRGSPRSEAAYLFLLYQVMKGTGWRVWRYGGM